MTAPKLFALALVASFCAVAPALAGEPEAKRTAVSLAAGDDLGILAFPELISGEVRPVQQPPAKLAEADEETPASSK